MPKSKKQFEAQERGGVGAGGGKCAEPVTLTMT